MASPTSVELHLPSCTSRFNPEQAPSAEWAPFGSYFFLLPSVELVEGPQNTFLACNLAWEEDGMVFNERVRGCGLGDLKSAVEMTERLLQDIVLPPAPAVRVPRVKRQAL